VKTVPSNWRAFSNLAGVYAERGDDAAALAALDRSLALAPTEVKSLYNRGNARRRRGDWSGAEQDYRRAVEIDPSHAEARNNLAMLLKQRGDGDGAVEQLELTLRHQPRHASAWYNLALVRYERREYGASLDAIQEYVALRADSAKGWSLAGDIQSALGNVPAARQAYRRALEVDPSQSMVATKLAALEQRLPSREAVAPSP
jgi:Flp pilus assembly protein TadD